MSTIEKPLLTSSLFLEFLQEVIGKGLQERGIQVTMIRRKSTIEIVP